MGEPGVQVPGAVAIRVRTAVRLTRRSRGAENAAPASTLGGRRAQRGDRDDYRRVGAPLVVAVATLLVSITWSS